MTATGTPPDSLDASLPSTRAAAVANELRRLIQSGELAPGTRVRQAAIAERFGISTTPVREAFMTLAREGVLRHDAHRGAVVFAPQLSDLEENYEIRFALEPLAAELATKNITEEQIEQLGTLIAKMRAEEDLNRYHDLNRQFHALIYHAANRPRLYEYIEQLRDSSEAYFRLMAKVVDEPAHDAYQQQVHLEHEGIAQALADRNGRSARKLMVQHLQHNQREIERLVTSRAKDNAGS